MTAREIAALAGEYIDLRRGLGYHSPTSERAARALARHLDEAGISRPVPAEASLDWATSTSSADPRNPARRLTAVRGFLRFLAATDGATSVPPPGILGPASHRTPPHVYSAAEITGLLDAAAALPGGLRPRCYATLLGLLACTGLRIGEALSLSCGDADLDEGVLTVCGKRGRVRLVPLHPTALAPLREYAAERERRYGQPGKDDAFFRADTSARLTYDAVSSTFTRMRSRLGWTADGRARAPRIHDLRHTMIVRRIQAWHAEGADLDAKAAVLATYVGHQLISDLYWYMSAVPELMSIIGGRFEDFARASQGGA